VTVRRSWGWCWRAAVTAPVRRLWVGATVVMLLIALPTGAIAQGTDRAREQREQLERIRRERAQLEREMQRLQGTAHTLQEEVRNLDRQADATARAVKALEQQLASIEDDVERATTELYTAERELAVRQGALRHRIVSIYMRGPLHATEALLAAPTFGELVARYKYLHLLAQHDRAVVRRVVTLRDRVDQQRMALVRLQSAVQDSRSDKEREEERLRALERQRASSLLQTQARAKQIAARTEQLRRDEQRLNSLFATFEAERRRAERARPNAPRASSTLTTASLGRLDWPVEGTILYRFGRVVNANRTTVRWNGIGIGAPVGSSVRAVESGIVVSDEPLGTYGATLIVQHGGGDYSVYASLARLDVRKGARVTKGQAIGTVGATDPELPPHLHFEIRPDGRAVDPLTWLRNR